MCQAPDGQFFPQVVSDGQGGTIVIWEDYRSGTNWDIFAQRIDASGKQLWPESGLSICEEGGYQRLLRMVKSGDQFVMVWTDHRSPRNWDIYAQALDLEGRLLWQPGGVPVCVDPAEQTNPTILSDGTGGVILVWEDERRSRESQNLYLQRLDADGTPQLPEDGVAVSPADGMQSNARLIADATGGFYFVWWDVVGTDEWHINAHRFDRTGQPVWPEPIRVSPDEGTQGEPQAVSDDNGGIIIVWQNYTNFINDDLYAQRVDSGGRRLWQEDGALVCNASGIQKEASVVGDGEGGAVVIWRDERDVFSDLYAQHLSPDGTRLWAEEGMPVCLAGGHQARPYLVRPDGDHFFVAWLDYREDYGDKLTEAIYAQLLDRQGNPLWEIDGRPICTAQGKQNPPFTVHTDESHISVVWSDARSDIGDVFLYRIGFGGKEDQQ